MKTIKEGAQPHHTPWDSGENRDGHALKLLQLYAFPVNFDLIPAIT